jgi:nitroimidazol reductase NimA-like FMN-containing flavoprotein (pyridoxamine 5'-phosphate oxidase superfamily)
MADHVPPSSRTRVRRIAERGNYDPAVIESIIDEAYLCHVAFPDGQGVHCIPTSCWREGRHFYVHGSNGSRMLKALLQAECCVTITHLDGLVLARSAFNHSMNYRSTVVYGRFEMVEESAKAAALDAFLEHVAPGRRHEVRPPDRTELAATTILRMSLDEAAAKVRNGGPGDDLADMARPVWAGVLPLALRELAPQPDLPADAVAPASPPDYVQAWGRGAFTAD